MTETINLDTVMSEIGSFGKFQIRLFLCLMFPVMFKAIHGTQFVFCAGPVEYRCKVPQCESSPPEFKPGEWAKFALPESNSNCHRRVPIGDTCEKSSFSNKTEKCSSWIYENANTIVTEFNLACQDWKRTMVGTVINLAYFSSLPLIAYLSDAFGRRRALIFTSVAPAFVGVSRAFVNNYYLYLLLDFIGAFFGSGTYSTAFILGLEMVCVKRRVLAGNLLAMMYASGQSSLGLVASLIPYWKYLTLVIYTSSFTLITYVWTIQESLHWLISKGRRHEAVAIILKAARVNNKMLSLNTMAMLSGEGSSLTEASQGNVKKLTTKDILKQVLRSKTIMLRVCVCSFCWITMTIVYYGLSINSVSLAGNRYYNFILSSLMEIPGYILSFLTLDRFGRKISITTANFGCGLALVSSSFTVNGTAVIALTMLGKLCISLTFCSIYIYTVELFPTQARHILMSICSMMGRIGSMFAPQTPLLTKYMKALPNLIFGALTVVAGLLMLLTPETLMLKLPETIEEAENMGVMPTTRKRTDMLRIDD